MRYLKNRLITIGLLAIFTSNAFGQQPLPSDWPQFRGLNSAGIASGKEPITEFSNRKNERWRIPVKSGHSSPCVVGDSIYLTTFDEVKNRLAVLGINRKDGKKLWQHQANFKQLEEFKHPSYNPASSTPACNGTHVVAYFGSAGVMCLSTDGRLAWQRSLAPAKSYSGNGTSPIIAGDKVILYRGDYENHFLWALDLESGEERWKVSLPEKITTDMACTSTPIHVGENLIIHSARAVQAFQLETGKLVWQLNCKTTGTSTPITIGHEVIIATWNQTGESGQTPELPEFLKLLEDHDLNEDGVISNNEFPRMMIFHRSEGTEAPQNGRPLRFRSVDTNQSGRINTREWESYLKKDQARRKTYVSHGLIAIKLDSQGSLTEDKIRYLLREGIPEVPSPIAHQNKIYLVKNGGILTCVDVETGERLYRIRTQGKGTHYASPTIFGNNLYSIAGNGSISVIQLGETAKVISTTSVGEEIFATPAIVDGIIYLRTHSELIAFESPSER